MAEEPQDLNEFKRWDAVGASLFLAVVPAIMFWVFVEHNVVKFIMIGGVAGLVGLAVLILTLLFPERIVGRLVNLIGSIMAPAYLVLAIILFWNKWCKDEPEEPAPAVEQTATPATPQPQARP